MRTSKKTEKASIFKGIPENLPSLRFAYWLSRKASKLGFDWPTESGLLRKLDEELGEFREALRLKDACRIEEELGDLLFVLVNVARFHAIDPEDALNGTLQKFNSRFLFIESALARAGKSIRESNLKEMDRLWEKAKRTHRKIQAKVQVKAKGRSKPKHRDDKSIT